MSHRIFLSIFCLLASFGFMAPANAQVITRPVSAKPVGSVNASIQQDTLKAVVQLSMQNRGNDALTVLTNAVNTNVISSDHQTMAMQMSQPDAAALVAMNSGATMTPQQVMQMVSHLSAQHRGDEAIALYKQALDQKIIKRTP